MGSENSSEEHDSKEGEEEQVAAKEEKLEEEADEIIRECEANYNEMERDGTLRRLNRKSHRFNEFNVGGNIDEKEGDKQKPRPESAPAENNDSDNDSSAQSSDAYIEDDV